jgi:hypothetical protein
VEYTTTGATDDNHHLEQRPSSVSEFTQEEEGLVARMEEIIQFFLELALEKMYMVLDRSPLEQGSPSTDTNRTTTSINFHDI